MKKNENKNTAIWFILMVGSILYLLNIGFGAIEALPDNVPFVGNVDEFVASLILMKSLRELDLWG